MAWPNKILGARAASGDTTKKGERAIISSRILFPARHVKEDERG